jgi:hypothetical protein
MCQEQNDNGLYNTERLRQIQQKRMIIEPYLLFQIHTSDTFSWQTKAKRTKTSNKPFRNNRE